MRKKYVHIIIDELPLVEFDSNNKEIVRAKTYFIEKKTSAYFDNFLETLMDRRTNKSPKSTNDFII